MTFLRHRQVGITRVSPHAGNKRYAIPGGRRGRGEAGYPDDATYYDGASFTARAAAFANTGEFTTFTASIWVRIENWASTAVQLARTGNLGFGFDFNAAGRIRFQGGTNAQAVIADVRGPPGDPSLAGFHHFIVAGDLNAGTLLGYFNGSADDVVFNANIPGLVDFTQANFAIGARHNSISFMDGCVGEVYINTTEFIDISDQAELAKFIDVDLFPVELGANGELPTGSPPAIYIKDGGRTLTNQGTGGDFDQIIGPPVKCTIPGPQEP